MKLVISIDGYEIELNKIDGDFSIDVRAPCVSKEVSEGECPHINTESVDVDGDPSILFQCEDCGMYRTGYGDWIEQ